MDLPENKGTYVLITRVAQMKRLEIGSLGDGYSKRRPSFRWFQERVMETFEGVEVAQYWVSPTASGVSGV